MLKKVDIHWLLVGLRMAIAACLLNTLEEIIMTLILPKWQCDILSVFHAMQLRRTLLLESN